MKRLKTNGKMKENASKCTLYQIIDKLLFGVLLFSLIGMLLLSYYNVLSIYWVLIPGGVHLIYLRLKNKHW
jgi:hypothetical protein